MGSGAITDVLAPSCHCRDCRSPYSLCHVCQTHADGLDPLQCQKWQQTFRISNLSCWIANNFPFSSYDFVTPSCLYCGSFPETFAHWVLMSFQSEQLHWCLPESCFPCPQRQEEPGGRIRIFAQRGGSCCPGIMVEKSSLHAQHQRVLCSFITTCCKWNISLSCFNPLAMDFRKNTSNVCNVHPGETTNGWLENLDFN